MGKTDDRSLLEQILQAWRVNNSINSKLVRAIPQKGFAAVPLASRGRTVLRQLLHIHKVHVGWLRYFGMKLPAKARPFKKGASPSRAQLVAAFRAADKASEAYLREKLESGGRVKFFQRSEERRVGKECRL